LYVLAETLFVSDVWKYIVPPLGRPEFVAKLLSTNIRVLKL
jgi:hypothetical protein